MTREEQIGIFIKKSVEGIEDSDTRTAAAITLAAGIHWADSCPNWISVEEELPKEGQVVFIYTKHGSVSSVTYKDGAFNLNEVLEAINVTHWMEIVPPRKEANNE